MKPFARILALLVAGLALPQGAEAQVRLETSGQLALARKAALRPAQEAALSRFRQSHDYYGAFYVSRGSEASHGHAGASSLAAASTIAKMGCERKSRGPCVLQAVIVPKSANTGPKGRIDISGTLANVMDDRFDSLQRGRWTAFATAPEGAWGAANNLSRGAQAEAQALGQCRAAASKARGAYPATMARAMAARGMFGCSTVLVLQK
ncbi:hypothetical protein [Vannielia litorea]|uniref:Uncharacterized protein n=1 Tax=Vannielia litorea TaxID=1217970 RepID=A0A1N6FJD8_9RHOB|nr:hypothetical protein [Vannielia litorea]SIN95371.1 hypothetical protein SAMN05444002_1716 [Vannielia litorea]